MATMTITIVSGLGTSTKTLTFSSTDASRIISAYRTASNNPSGTQDQFLNWLSNRTTSEIGDLVQRIEAIPPAPPVFS